MLAKEELKEALKGVLSDLFNTAKDTEKDNRKKYVLVVDDEVCKQRIKTKAELLKIVQAITIQKPTAKFEVYEFSTELRVDLPISGFVTEVQHEEEVTNG